MTPRSFAALAVIAAISFAAAVAVYTSSIEWSRANLSGSPLFADLDGKAKDVAKIEISGGGNKITLERQGDGWSLSEYDSFPAVGSKVDALLRSLSQAELVEPKTRKEDRYAMLGVEDPEVKDAKSLLVRLLDDKGTVLATAIVGERRVDAFGLGRSGTYVRKPGDEQAWLASADIEAGVELRDWINPQLFTARTQDVKSMELAIPGEERLEIVRDPERPGHTLSGIPDGMKLKYVNIVDNIVGAATTLDFDDVRKQGQAPGDDEVSVVTIELEGGLTVTARIWKEGASNWLSLAASGEGDSKSDAASLAKRTKGWEFRISESRARQILKRRDELLERVSS